MIPFDIFRTYWLQLHLQSFTHTLCRFALGKLYKLRPDDILPVSCCGQVLLNPNAFWLLTWIANIDNLLSLLLSCPLSTPPPTSFKLFSAMWHYFLRLCPEVIVIFLVLISFFVKGPPHLIKELKMTPY